MYACLGVNYHLHFWQNDRGLLRATAITRVERTQNKSQHTKFLEKKIIPPLLPGFELATFRSRVRFVCCPFHPRVTAVARKRPRSFCQKCRWQVIPEHAYIPDPTKSEWADNAAYPETRTHATRQETLGHSRLSSLSHYRLILA